jgi:hypothetical protein
MSPWWLVPVALVVAASAAAVAVRRRQARERIHADRLRRQEKMVARTRKRWDQAVSRHGVLGRGAAQEQATRPDA